MVSFLTLKSRMISPAMVSPFPNKRTAGYTESNWKQFFFSEQTLWNTCLIQAKNTTWGIFLYCVVGESVLVRGDNIWP